MNNTQFMFRASNNILPNNLQLLYVYYTYITNAV